MEGPPEGRWRVRRIRPPNPTPFERGDLRVSLCGPVLVGGGWQDRVAEAFADFPDTIILLDPSQPDVDPRLVDGGVEQQFRWEVRAMRRR